MSVFSDRLESLGFSSYSEYLSSDHWRLFKESYRKSDRPMKCAVCCAGKIQLHHHTYVRLGKEKLDDVTPLCRVHHEAVHGWLKDNRKMVNATHLAIGFLKGEVHQNKNKKKAPRKRKPKNKTRVYNRTPKLERRAARLARRALKAEKIAGKMALRAAHLEKKLLAAKSLAEYRASRNIQSLRT